MPRAENSLELKLALKVRQLSKKDLCGLWQTLAPGTVVSLTSPTTTVKEEPGVAAVRVRNNVNIAKFGTKSEEKYAQERPFPMKRQLRKNCTINQRL